MKHSIQTFLNLVVETGMTRPCTPETAEKQIGKMGRVLIRKSGTEELIRVMVESEDEVLMLKLVDDINSKLLECEVN